MKYKVGWMIELLMMANMNDPAQYKKIKDFYVTGRGRGDILKNLETWYEQNSRSSPSPSESGAKELTGDERRIISAVLFLKLKEPFIDNLSETDSKEIQQVINSIWYDYAPTSHYIPGLRAFTDSMLPRPDATPAQTIDLLRALVLDSDAYVTKPSVLTKSRLNRKSSEEPDKVLNKILHDLTPKPGVSFEMIKTELTRLAGENNIKVTPDFLAKLQTKMATSVDATPVVLDATPAQTIDLLRALALDSDAYFTEPSMLAKRRLNRKSSEEPDEALNKILHDLTPKPGVSFEMIKTELTRLAGENNIKVTPDFLAKLQTKMATSTKNAETTKKYRSTMVKHGDSTDAPPPTRSNKP